MALKIRLRQQGRTNRPFYRLVLTDVRAPRDGKYIEALGWYNPFEAELDKSIFLDAARVQHWLSMGAQFSDSAESLVAKVAPSVVNANIAKDVASRAKAAAKRKARKKAAA
ncbi:MAG: 30S ribosomal protein S16 [Parachlamydiaceae bacterium]|nr:30S ribosomal protein S16 [Parachlamydiaceae bacterium]